MKVYYNPEETADFLKMMRKRYAGVAGDTEATEAEIQRGRVENSELESERLLLFRRGQELVLDGAGIDAWEGFGITKSAGQGGLAELVT